VLLVINIVNLFIAGIVYVVNLSLFTVKCVSRKSLNAIY